MKALARSGFLAAGGILLAAVLAAPAGAASGPGAAAALATATEAPLPAGANADPGVRQVAVSCPASGHCVAVGEYDDTSFGLQGLAETLSGGSWHAAELPLPANTVSPPVVQMAAVSCASASSCVATGTYATSTSHEGLIETLSGGTWHAAEAPLPAGMFYPPDPAVVLDAVSCRSGTCAAVGSNLYLDTEGDTVSSALIETLANGTWTPSEAPAPGAGFTTVLAAVSCASAKFCVAAGTGGNSCGTCSATEPLLETWSAGAWKPRVPPLPAGSTGKSGGLSAVSCWPPGACAAAGRYQTGKQGMQPLAVTLAGGTWTAASPGLPPGAMTGTGQSSGLQALACPAANACAATGTYATSSGNQGLIETLSGSTWTPLAAPPPPHTTGTTLFGTGSAACPAAGACAAAGYNGLGGVLDMLASGHWSASQAPVPGNAGSGTFVRLGPVACPATGTCAAAGTYQDISGNQQGLLEVFPG
jgi:hypothetical protein